MHSAQSQQQPGSESAAGAVDEKELVRSYRTWKGSNIFLLDGRLIFGPDARSILLTVSLITAPVAVFCVFVARKLMDDFPNHLGILIMVVVIAWTLFVSILLMLTSGRDPGIIPRNLHPPEPEGYYDESIHTDTPQLRFPRTKDVDVNGVTIRVKYCDTCMLYRPPRCSHCSICNNCIQNFDHHCPWIGQCIGQRNYRFFFMFISCTTLLCLYVHVFCWVYIRRIMDGEVLSIWKAMIKTPASIALIIYTFLTFWFVGGLTFFHLYLISTNQSTYENFRYRYDRQFNPFNKGVISNFMETFCTIIPPSKNNFRKKVRVESFIPPGTLGGGFNDHTMGKANGDIEMGRKAGWHDTSAEADDREEHISNDDDSQKDDTLNVIEVSTDLSRIHPLESTERHGVSHSRRSSWEKRNENLNKSTEDYTDEHSESDLR